MKKLLFFIFFIGLFSGFSLMKAQSTKDSVVPSHKSDDGVLVAYPNPAKDFIEIKTNTKIESVQICDNLGRILKTENTAKINVSNLEKGVYYLKINNGEKIEKFIKN